jgi:hypothetical protein
MLPLAKQSLDEAPYKLSGAVTQLVGITFSRLAFSYWIDYLGFISEGKLAAIFIKPSLGVSNWPVIYYTFPRQLGTKSFMSLLPGIEEEAPTPSSPHHHWVPSDFKQKDLDMAQADGLISDDDQVIFPSSERIPKPPSGFRVMFLTFFLRGLSFPAHEFVRGLLFVYGVQLHQLTPNSILHIACFITLCESFVGIEPHFLLWKFLFRLRPSVALSKKPELGGVIRLQRIHNF